MKIFSVSGYEIKAIFVASLLALAGCQGISPITEPSVGEPPEAAETAFSSASEAVVTENTETAAQALECPVIEAKLCPQPLANNQAKNFTLDDKVVTGRVENVILLPKKLKMTAKIDTGARTSSLHATNLTEFERDGKDWVRFAMVNPKTENNIYFERAVIRKTKVKQLNTDLQHRPTVMMTIILGPMEEQVEFTLADRTGYLYQVLIGRNVLRNRFIVDVSRTFLTSSTE